MTDSISFIEDDRDARVPRLHSGISLRGKLHKGHCIAAASASIPTKYQTIVTPRSDRKGFNSQTTRFFYSQNDNPSPATYVVHSHNTSSPSYSKRGTGGFASKELRALKFNDPGEPSPGPLDYSLPSSLVSRKDFNRASARIFHKPIAVITEEHVKTRLKSPAPNSYLVKFTSSSRTKNNNVTASASFKSLSPRKLTTHVDKTPAPCQYVLNDEQIKTATPGTTHCFKSATRRDFPPDPQEVPGPGTYEPFASVKPVAKLVLPKRHRLCISAPAMPPSSRDPSPGPGHYDVSSPNSIVKLPVPGVAFTSAKSRWAPAHSGEVKPEYSPGPAYYRPMEHVRPSFIYNAVGRWI